MEFEQSLNLQYWVYLFLSGFFFSTGILLILIYFFNQGKISFLYYSLTVFIASIIQILYYLRGVNFFLEPESYSIFNWQHYDKFHILLNVLVHVGFLLFISASIQSGKLITLLYAFASFLLIVLLVSSNDFQEKGSLFAFFRSGLNVFYYLTVVSFLVKGYLKKIPFINLIIFAVVIYMITEIFITADYFRVWSGYTFHRSVLWIFGLTVPFVLYSVFLSKDLALTSKLLTDEILANSKLKLKELEAKKYQELNNLKSRFFANISHEFRTPLTLLLGPIEKRLKISQEASDKIELSIMHRNASRLLTLVNQLLDLSRIEAGTLSLKCSQGSLNSFIHSIASQFSSMGDSKEINFTISATQEITLYFDPDKLEKIITNLLSNAFKFTPNKGSITITVSQHRSSESFKDGFAEIEVRDTGQGIAHEHLIKIFDRFYQADASSTREYEGSGIGLALTKELVELHGGSISVTSLKDEGSCFSVKLPLGSTHLKPQEIIAAVEPILPLHVVQDLPTVPEVPTISAEETELPKVLIVEDNADLRYYFQTNFAGHYSILEARDGEMGLAMAIEGVPDLIISDLMMPKMDGMNLCLQVKANEKTSHIPIILLTARADIESKLQGLTTGADDYIAKPFDARELEVRVRNLIESRKKLQQKFSQQFTLKASEFKVESVEDRFLKKVRNTIEEHLADATFGVESLAGEVAMSSVQVYRKLKALTGYTPNELIRNIRLERAASLLSQHAGNVSDVAYQVGFSNLSYFAKCFKEKFEVSPSDFLSSSKK